MIMTKNNTITNRADDFALLIKNHTYILDNKKMVVLLDTIGLLDATNHLANDTDLINKVSILAEMVTNDLTLLDKDVQTDLWNMVN